MANVVLSEARGSEDACLGMNQRLHELPQVSAAAGAGKSTLMSLLSGRLAAARGGLLYNKRPLGSLIAQRYAALGSQSDEHLGGLSIRETLQFARPFMNSVHTQSLRLDEEAARFLEEALEEGEDLLVQSRLGMLGLTRSAGLLVGSNTVSDDERHRLTTSELLLGPNPVRG